MILMPGQQAYDLPVFDKLDNALLRGPADANTDRILEIVTLAVLKHDKYKEECTSGKIRGKPVEIAIEHNKIYFYPTPDKSYIVDLAIWHKVTI